MNIKNHWQYFIFDKINTVKNSRLECPRYANGNIFFGIDIYHISAVTDSGIYSFIFMRSVP